MVLLDQLRKNGVSRRSMADHYISSNRVVHFYYGSKRQNLGNFFASRRYHQPPPSWSLFKLGRETKFYPHVTPKILKRSTIKDSNSHSVSDAVFRANMCKDVKLSYSHSRAKVEEPNYMGMDVKPRAMMEDVASSAKVEEDVVRANYMGNSSLAKVEEDVVRANSTSDAVFRANMCNDVKVSYSHSRAKVEEPNYMGMDVKPPVMVEDVASSAKVEEDVVRANYMGNSSHAKVEEDVVQANYVGNSSRAEVEEAVVQANYNTREDVKLVLSNSSSFRSRSRAKVEELLKEFHKMLKEKLREDSLKPRAVKRMSVLIKLTMTLIRSKSVKMVKTLGHIPGVRIGDEFEYRAELYLIGLHRQFTKGIDFLKDKNGVLFATSIVVTTREFYDNSIDLRNGVIIYSGEGGNPNCALKGPVMDQKLRCGNLGLKNSKEYRKPVRVVIKRSQGKQDPYVYHGLYMVEKYWKVRKGDFGTSIFNFQLRKIAGQSSCF